MTTFASIWIGFDQREVCPYAVARHSLCRHLSRDIAVHGLVLPVLQKINLYRRPIEYRQSAADRPVMWDTISDAPMSTQHANARFLIPQLSESSWALFMDGDMLIRGDLAPLFDDLDPAKAVYCVQHRHEPRATTKMDGQIQTRYHRKNWTSFCLFNCQHPANLVLADIANTLPGRDLHRFCWLDDDEIGELHPKFNWLVGHSDPAIDPVVVHFTEGTPDMDGYADVPFADEWRAELALWASGRDWESVTRQ